jgi:hypothetical protein
VNSLYERREVGSLNSRITVVPACEFTRRVSSTALYPDLYTASPFSNKGENDHEPDPPQGHLVGGMAGGSLAEQHESHQADGWESSPQP